jgi:ABC-type multidrug transport system fused ATPase/permease subunit
MKALKNVSHENRKWENNCFGWIKWRRKINIINLLCKFYEPDSGEILLDGNNLNDFDNDYLRDDLGWYFRKITFSKEVLKIISDTEI